MSEMVDRATAGVIALLEKESGPYSHAEREPGTTIMCLDGNFDIADIVRAAMAAMREPTDAMFLAVVRANRGHGNPAAIKGDWRTMIDGALT